MIDICRDDGSSASDFIADEFRRDSSGMMAPERPPRVLLAKNFGNLLLFAQGDEFHFRGDDAFPRVMHLRDIMAGFGTVRFVRRVKT